MKTKISNMLLALTAAVLLPVTSNASTFGFTSTYSDILWTVSTNASGFNLCTPPVPELPATPTPVSLESKEVGMKYNN